MRLARFGGIAVDPSLRSSHPKVWAGGDVAFGPRNLIDAIADGRRAAASIDAVLSGQGQAVQHEVAVELHVEPFYRRLATGYDGIARVTVPSVPPWELLRPLT